MKEKQSRIKESKEETIFYYEFVGFISIILSIVIVARLGKVGEIITILFKVGFGDWYLLIVLLLFIFGIHNVINHDHFDFTNQKFLGIVSCSVGLLMLAHFPVHNYISKQGNSYFAQTWNHYRNFMSLKNDMYLGGGMFGGMLFYVIYVLLGSFGVILVSLIMLLLGITMIANKSITEITVNVFKRMKDAKKYGKNFQNFFKYEIGKNKSHYQRSIYDLSTTISLKHFDDFKNDITFQYQERKRLEYKNIIISTLNKLKYTFNEQNSFVSFSALYFSFYIYNEFDCQSIGKYLEKTITEIMYIKKKKNTLIIEINCPDYSVLTIKEMLLKQDMLLDNYNIPVGINLQNDLEVIDIIKCGNILLIGDYGSGIRTFVSSLIVSLFIKVKPIYYEFNIYDEANDFYEYKDIFHTICNNNLKEYIDKIVTIIDERSRILHNLKINTIEEYNNSQENETMNRIFYIVNFTSTLSAIEQKYFEDKVMFIIQVGKNVGINIILIKRGTDNISSVVISLFQSKLFFKTNTFIKLKSVVDSNHYSVLKNSGEAILIKDSQDSRIQCPLLTTKEIKKIIKS